MNPSLPGTVGRSLRARSFFHPPSIHRSDKTLLDLCFTSLKLDKKWNALLPFIGRHCRRSTRFNPTEPERSKPPLSLVSPRGFEPLLPP